MVVPLDDFQICKQSRVVKRRADLANSSAHVDVVLSIFEDAGNLKSSFFCASTHGAIKTHSIARHQNNPVEFRARQLDVGVAALFARRKMGGELALDFFYHGKVGIGHTLATLFEW